jgi:hypothetical protein
MLQKFSLLWLLIVKLTIIRLLNGIVEKDSIGVVDNNQTKLTNSFYNRFSSAEGCLNILPPF